jgi:hypothetical protein
MLQRTTILPALLASTLLGGSVIVACSGADSVPILDVDASDDVDGRAPDANGPDSDAGDADAEGARDGDAGVDASDDAADAASDGNDGGEGVDGGDGGDGGDAIADADAGPDVACIGTSTKVQQPLDIYIMLDQSGSMQESVPGGGTKWAAVTSALNTFVSGPANGVSVGLQYFGLSAPGTACPSSCSSDTDCGPSGGPCLSNTCLGCLSTGTDSCNAADYATPDVEIAPLPGSAVAIAASIGAHTPTTATPTSAALQGAVDHAKTWAQAHPGHVVIALLATDGDPTECDTSLPNINAIASTAAAGNPSIPTFVIGVGSSLTALNGIALAGGTHQAFIVDTTQQSVNQQFLDALNAIRVAASGCQYDIPLPASAVPASQLGMKIKSISGEQSLPKVAGKASCPVTGDAWYFDNNATPTKILLCEATCKRVATETGDEVDVVTPCVAGDH